MRLCFWRAAAYEIEQRHRPMYGGILWFERVCIPKRLLGGSAIPERPFAIGQREARISGLWRDRHSLAECRLRFSLPSGHKARRTERTPCRRRLRIECDRLFHLLDRSAGVVEAGQSIAEENMRRGIVRIGPDRKLRARTGHVVLA